MTLLLTHQPDSLPPGRYVMTLNDKGGIATAVDYKAAPDFDTMWWSRQLPAWEKTLIQLDGPLDLAHHVVGQHFTQTFARPKRFKTMKELLDEQSRRLSARS